MYTGQLVFSHVTDQLPMHTFRRCVQRYEVLVSGTTLADGIGFELLTFSQAIDMKTLSVQARAPCFGASGTRTPFVPATLIPNP